MKIEQGSILVEWATRNVRFYKVVKATDKMITVREVAQINLFDAEKPGGYSYAVMPNANEWEACSKEITKKVKYFEGTPYVVPHVGGHSAKPWNGEVVYHY